MRRRLALVLTLVALAACDAPPPPAPAAPARVGPLPSPVPPRPVAPSSSSPDAGATGPAPITAPSAAGRPKLIDFTRDYCLPCELMRPEFEKVQRELAGRVDVVELNIDRPENQPLGMYFRIHAIPTQVYVDAQGRERRRHPGPADARLMTRTCEELGFLKQP